jgi:hypothetical protein
MQQAKAIPTSTGTVKKHIGSEGTMRRYDSQISSSPGLANPTMKLNNSPSRKAFSVQDKVCFVVRQTTSHITEPG